MTAFVIITSVYFYSRFLGYYSDQEISIWNYGFLMNSNNSLYYYLSKAAPLSIYNIMNLYRFSIFEVTIHTPFFLGIFAILGVLTFPLKKLVSHGYPMRSAESFIIFALNPYIINLLCNDTTGLIVAITTFLIFYGVHLYSYDHSSKGIFLFAIGLTVLIASGEIGLTFFLSIFFFIPILLKRLFDEHPPVGVYFLFIFPAVATILSMIYLGWLSNVPLESVFFINPKAFNDYSSLLNWIIFIPIIAYSVISSHPLTLRQFVTRNISILVPFLAQVFLISIDREYPFEIFISISMLLLALSIVGTKSKGKQYLVAAIYLLIVSWISLFIQPKNQMGTFFETLINRAQVTSIEDTEFQKWLSEQSSLKTIIVSGDAFKATYLNPNANDITEHHSKLYFSDLTQIDKNFDRVIVSRSDLDSRNGPYPSFQHDLYSNAPHQFYSVFNNGKWRVYQRSMYHANDDIIGRPLKHILFDNFMKDLLYMIIIFDLILIGWKINTKVKSTNLKGLSKNENTI